MTTRRDVRLVRTACLHEYQRALTAAACDGGLALVRRTAVLVPTRAAAIQLQRTFEHLRLDAPGAAMVLPDLLTRTDWYERLRLSHDPPGEWLTAFDREVLLQAGAHEAITDGILPPFHLRPALVGEMLELYDELRRHQRGVGDFERLLGGELEPRATADRGAERMLRQTLFLAAAFRSYERRMADAGGLDEHAFRAWVIDARVELKYARVIVAVGDRVAEPGGLWPADFDLLVRAAGVDRIDIVATDAQLAGGLHVRIHDLLPGIDELRPPPVDAPLDERVLVVPPEGAALFHTSRDREDEIAAVVRRVKARLRETPGAMRLDRTAVIVARPLPYVYVARGVFEAACVPFQCDDALPLAAEPGAAALDLVLAFVSSRASRSATVALLRSPHVTLGGGAPPVPPDAVEALDRALADIGYGGDPARLGRLADEWEQEQAATDPRTADLRRRAVSAARAAAMLADHLAPLFDAAPASVHLETLGRFLLAHGHVPGPTDAEHERLLRARAALLMLLDGLAAAHRRHGDLRWTIDDLPATVRRWIESHTFSPRRGAAGVHLVDATAARFGVFDDVHLVGLVEGEWPSPPRRNVFYSPVLLQPLGWPAETTRLAGARASFADLLGLARQRTSVSRFQLEDDSLVGPAALLDDIARAGLTPLAHADAADLIFTAEALVARPAVAGALSEEPAAWLRLRHARTDATHGSFHGTARPHRPRTHGVGAVELYAQCPFKYFARHVLRLEEESEDEIGLTPRERGIVLHEVFHAFFARWQAEVGRVLTPADLPRARALLEDVMKARLAVLSPSDAAIERTRLLGSPVAPGLADLVLRMEAERGVPVIDRRLEERFDGVFELVGTDGLRRLPIRGVVDRIDLLADGALRVIDYKSSVPPAALQLAIYAVTAAQRLQGHRGRRWTVGEVSYVVFNGARVRPVGRNADDRARALADAQLRFVAAADAIHAGAFPPRPAVEHLCNSCAYAGVCRMDYVAEPEDADTAAAV